MNRESICRCLVWPAEAKVGSEKRVLRRRLQLPNSLGSILSRERTEPRADPPWYRLLFLFGNPPLYFGGGRPRKERSGNDCRHAPLLAVETKVRYT